MSAKRLAAYCRTSREEAKKETKVESQIFTIENYARAHEDSVAAPLFYLDEDVSGIIPLAERPNGRRLVEDARSGKFDILAVKWLDRLGRTMRDILNVIHDFEQMGVTVVSIEENLPESGPMRTVMLGFLATMAEAERERIAERTQAGREKSMRLNKWLGGLAPLGYRVNEDKRLEIVEDEAEVVRLIYKLTIDGMSTFNIARHLNAQGVANYSTRRANQWKRHASNSKEWDRSAVTRIIHDSVYKGEFILGRQTKNPNAVTISVPPIVDEITWDQAQTSVTARRKGGRKPLLPYILSGLIRCTRCGSCYSGHSSVPREGAIYRYYRCARGYGGIHRLDCDNRPVGADWLESLVWADIEHFIQNPGKVLEAIAGQRKSDEETLATIDAELADIDQKLATDRERRNKIVKLYRDGLLDDEGVHEELSIFNREMDDTRRRREELHQTRLAVMSEESERDQIVKMLVELREKVANPTVEERREICRLLVKSITIDVVDGEQTVKVIYKFKKPESSRTGACECEQDLSHELADAPLPDEVASGQEPFLVIGAIAGG